LPAGEKGKKATGFAFDAPQPEVLLSTILLALRVYRDKEEWQGLMRRGMKQDFSWQRSAKQYVELYERALALDNGASPQATSSFPRGRPQG
jgi:starch synthase